jgi:hypothetical protein
LEYAIPFPAADHYLTIENNGLSALEFKLNGKTFTAGSITTGSGPNFPLSAYGALTLDLGKHLEPGINTLHVTELSESVQSGNAHRI